MFGGGKGVVSATSSTVRIQGDFNGDRKIDTATVRVNAPNVPAGMNYFTSNLVSVSWSGGNSSKFKVWKQIGGASVEQTLTKGSPVNCTPRRQILQGLGDEPSGSTSSTGKIDSFEVVVSAGNNVIGGVSCGLKGYDNCRTKINGVFAVFNTSPGQRTLHEINTCSLVPEASKAAKPINHGRRGSSGVLGETVGAGDEEADAVAEPHFHDDEGLPEIETPPATKRGKRKVERKPPVGRDDVMGPDFGD